MPSTSCKQATAESDTNSPSKEWFAAFCEKNTEASSVKYKMFFIQKGSTLGLNFSENTEKQQGRASFNLEKQLC